MQLSPKLVVVDSMNEVVPVEESDVRARRTTVAKLNGARDPRLPKPGTQIPRDYKGRTHFVEVLDDFETDRLRVVPQHQNSKMA